ncbi:MAG: tagaturonate epimerase family protein [Bacteroidota bacterium]|nr:tagaturonate epimerase family protein [Bacteroidota bacterium]
MELGKYSMGIGDRFHHQGKAQLTSLKYAEKDGLIITPVWNKSFREHQIIKSNPSDTRKEADMAVKDLKWEHPYFVDADHIGLRSVDYFLDSCDFFTLDVADYIGKQADENIIKSFSKRCKQYLGRLSLQGVDEPLCITEEVIKSVAEKFLFAVGEAGKIYRYILEKKGSDNFIVEVSMDETDLAQSPVELLLILAAISFENIPAQTIAPKFSGRFNKGVDYVGDVGKFTMEFEADLAVLNFAVKEFSLPAGLKLSIHSGSDKFSIYPAINKALKKFNAGIHLKTAGTTWLEELTGLALSEGEALRLTKEIYKKAFCRFEELCEPYRTVIDIEGANLPHPFHVDNWSGEKFASALRHDLSNSEYNLHFRQLLHVGYKIASEFNRKYLDALEKNENLIAKNVIENLFERHIKKILY